MRRLAELRAGKDADLSSNNGRSECHVIVASKKDMRETDPRRRTFVVSSFH